MLHHFLSVLAVASVASSAVLRRQDPPMQTIPTTGKPDGTFNNGAAQLAAEPPMTNEVPPPVYGARSIDLPFYRLFHGNMTFFSAGQLNTPTGRKDEWINTPANPTQNGIDSANQSACGIPDNAYSISKVAIHPYFLKYADLSRFCMQDVCISFWNKDGSSDMMLKVTDICNTDPLDPTHCATPSDIKVDRGKAQIMEKLTDPPDWQSHPQLTGDQYPDPIYWFFMKCWDDGLPQPAYQGNNWFTEPALPNNLDWAQKAANDSYTNNQVAYAAKNPPWPTYPMGGYVASAMKGQDDTENPLIAQLNDWVRGDEPTWTPIAGGKGWGIPSESGNSAPQPAASAEASVSTSISPPATPVSSLSAATTTAQESTQGSGQGENQGGGQGGGQVGGQDGGQGGGQGGAQGGSGGSSTTMADASSSVPVPVSNPAAAPTTASVPAPATSGVVSADNGGQGDCDDQGNSDVSELTTSGPILPTTTAVLAPASATSATELG